LELNSFLDLFGLLARSRVPQMYRNTAVAVTRDISHGIDDGITAIAVIAADLDEVSGRSFS
jgi:hypothetical protein